MAINYLSSRQSSMQFSPGRYLSAIALYIHTRHSKECQRCSTLPMIDEVVHI